MTREDLCIEPLERRRLLATFSVTSIAADGPGSLSEAVDLANAATGADVIDFNLPAGSTLAIGELLITDSLTIDGSTSDQNITLDAGGNNRHLRISATTLLNVDLRNLRFVNGLSTESGGAVLVAQGHDVSLTDVVLQNNQARNGGAVWGNGVLHFERVTLLNNYATSIGGAAGMGAGSLRIIDTLVEGNFAESLGGGVGMTGMEELFISNSRFVDNVADADNATAIGGGLFVIGATVGPSRVAILDSEFAGNQADFGGGINIDGASQIVLANSTITQNQARGGAGVYVYTLHDPAEAMIVNTTITDNHASSSGGGLIVAAFTSFASGPVPTFQATLTNSVVAGNTAAGDGMLFPEVREDLLQFEFSQFGGTQPGEVTLALTGPNLLGTEFVGDPLADAAVLTDDPMLLPLGFYGGDTRTMPPVVATSSTPGSPAYNAGDASLAVVPGPDGVIGTPDDAALTADQRGLPRTIYGHTDLGAAEAVLGGDANLDGAVDLQDFLVLRANFSTGSVFAEGDFDFDGDVDLQDFLILRTNFGDRAMIDEDDRSARGLLA